MTTTFVAATPGSLIRRVPAAVLFVGVACCWGLNSVAMRVTGRSVPPLTVATARAVVGGAILLTLARRRGASWPKGREEWTGLAWIALLMTGISTAGLFLAAKNAPAGVVSIFTNTMPLFTAMLAPLLLSERVTSRVLLGLGVGLCGTVLVAWRAIEGHIRPAGIVYGLIGASTSALGSIMYKRHPMPRLDRLMVVGMQLALSSIVLGVLASPDNRSHMTFPWTFTLSFVYLAVIGLALSFVMYSELLSRATTMQSSSVAYLATVTGVFFGAILLHERLSWLVLLGGAITIGGVALVQLGQARSLPFPRER
jgi:drug/metabolite transporter (DMT)-like permease